MNQQEQATKRAAIFQDTINGINDPTPWPVTMWATSGDTIWTAGTATTSGEDSVGMLYDPGDIIAHRSIIKGDRTRANESFAVKPSNGQKPIDAMIAEIEQWDQRHPDQWDTVSQPGEYRMTDPATKRPLPMGWSDSLAMAASTAGRLDPELLQASLMQDAIEHEPRPCVFFQEDNGYDLMVFSWHQNQQGLFDSMSFKHLQYDEMSMQVTVIAHNENGESFPAKTMSDGELLTQSRVYWDEYQAGREHDGGPVVKGMTGHIMRSGLLKPGLEQKPLLNLTNGRTAPDWNEFMDSTAVGILQGKPLAPLPALPRQEQPDERGEDQSMKQDQSTQTQPAKVKRQDWPNVWVANKLAHTYILHAKDGRDWPKMIVSLPQGTSINGQDLTGWATDLFMSAKNQSQKTEGRAVNLRFKPDNPVELFTGRGAERRATQVDPQTLAQAIISAQQRNREAGETLDTASVELTSKTVEESWPQIERMQDRFAEYQRNGTYKPAVALKWARRLIDRTAKPGEGQWTNRQRRQAAKLLIQEITAQETQEQTKTETKNQPGVQQHAPETVQTPATTSDTAAQPSQQPKKPAGQPEEKPASPQDGEAVTDAQTHSRNQTATHESAAETPDTARDDTPQRRKADLKSTLARFKTKLNENLGSLRSDYTSPTPNPERGHQKTL